MKSRRLALAIALLLLLGVGGSSAEATDFTGYYPSLIYGTVNLNPDDPDPMNVVVCVNFKSSDFTMAEVQSQFVLLTGASGLVEDYGSFGWIAPNDLTGVPSEFAVDYVQGQYKTLGFDLFLVVNVTKVNRSELAGTNERLDVFLANDTGKAAYVASVEFPMSFLSGGLSDLLL